MYNDLIELLLEMGNDLDFVYQYLVDLLGSEAAAQEAIGTEEVNF